MNDDELLAMTPDEIKFHLGEAVQRHEAASRNINLLRSFRRLMDEHPEVETVGEASRAAGVSMDDLVDNAADVLDDGAS